MFRRLALFIALALAPIARAAPIASPHATTELVAAAQGVAPGGTVQTAIVQTYDPGWHSYWRNPGDAGEAATLAWTLPPGWSAGPIQWPAPKRLPVGPIMNYGYEGRVALPVTLTAPASAKIGDTVTATVKIQFLVCAEVCVPDTTTVSLSLPVVATPEPDPKWSGPVAAALASLPKTALVQAAWRREGTGVKLAVAGPPLAGAAEQDAYFYPEDPNQLDHAKPQAIERGPRGLTLNLTPAGDFAKGGAPALTGVLVANSRAYEISAAQGAAPAGSSGLGAPARAAATGSAAGLLGAIVLAFVGGVILNLMPCVFPILSLKAAALAGRGEDGGPRGEAFAFLIGVVMSFLALAGALVAARAAGQAVGWGFQLQNPRIVALLALVMLSAALNLSGLFEVGTSAQGLGSGLAARGGLIGSAFTGVLAVVVAAPCTAPFMGPALGFALTQPAWACLAVFLGLALGFAAPFTLIALSPALMCRLPRPGGWMETFRKALAFPMYAAAAWLLWVLAQQTDSEGLARALAAAVLLGLALWLFGVWQQRRLVSARAPVRGGLAAIALVVGLAVVTVPAFAPPAAAGQVKGGAIAAEPWSADKVAALTAAGHPVFVNFTAAWCVTCQVNERGAFSSPEVASAFKRTGAAYLVADWTNRDAGIASALKSQGRIGVPLYLVYGKSGGEPQVLSQILTPGAVSAALDRASRQG